MGEQLLAPGADLGLERDGWPRSRRPAGGATGDDGTTPSSSACSAPGRRGARARRCPAYLHQAALGMIGAGVRRVPVGHTHGQQILAYLHDDIDAAGRDARRARPGDRRQRLPRSTRCSAMNRLDSTPDSSDPDAAAGPRRAAFRPLAPRPQGRSHHDPHDHDHMGGPGRAVRRAAAARPSRSASAGPVGSGKTALVERLCRELWPEVNLAVITNDIYTHEDAEFLSRREVLPLERIVGVETGGCPHTAIRDDASGNLGADRQPGAAVPRTWRWSSSSRAATT